MHAIDRSVQSSIFRIVYFPMTHHDHITTQDAINFVPASADGVLTVGALDTQDAKASYSNFGSTLELYAPGSRYVGWRGAGWCVRCGRAVGSSLPAMPCQAMTIHAHTHTHTHTRISSIYSSFYTGNGNYWYMSGTSMATPAVAGGVACLMAADPSRVCSTKNAIAAQRLADAMTSDKSPRRRSGDLPITQKIFYVPHDRQVACPDTSF